MGYKKITKFDLFYWIDASNIETKEKDILKTKINKIETGDNGKLFKDLPDTYPICTEYKNGVSCLYVLNKWYYGEEKKKSIFDLMLKRSEWKERLLTQLKKFASEIEAVSIDQSIDEAKNYLEYNKLQRIKQGRVFNVITIFCVLIALALLCLVMADAIVAFDNESIIYKFITPGATMCGILDFIFGILFFRKERAEDDRERFLMLAIAKDQKKSLRNTNKKLEQRNKEYESNNNNLNKQVEELRISNKEYESNNNNLNKQVEELRISNKEYESNNNNLNKQVEELRKKNDELTDTINKAKGIGEICSLQQEKLEQKEANLGICEQCQVPIRNICKICGHVKGSEISNKWSSVATDGKNYKIIEDIDNNWLTIVFTGKDIVLDKELESIPGTTKIDHIIFTNNVDTIRLSEEIKYNNLRSLVPSLLAVGFAKPTEACKRYKLYGPIFKDMGDLKDSILGLEYVENADKDCFEGWPQVGYKTE